MIVSLLGLVISLFTYLIAFPKPYQRRFDIFAALLALHIAAAIGYWLLSFESGMDAFLYYRDPYNFMARSAFQSGTYFMVHLVQSIRSTLGGSFLDHFLLFQSFGMIGVALMIRCFNEIAESLGAAVPTKIYLILLLPGLHFWTGGIGKDSPMIMAVCLAVWATLRLQRRYLWLALAVAIMVLIRPHVGAVTLLAAVCSLLFTSNVSAKVKIVLAPIAILGTSVVVSRSLSDLGIDLDPDSISSFIETQQGYGSEYGSGANLEALPFPLKVLTLLFRPFFFDAGGLTGVMASMENSFLLLIYGYIIYNWRLLIMLLRTMPYVLYCTIFSTVLTLMLAAISYNIGLGQRQKMMVVPAILILFGTLFMYKRFLASARLPQASGVQAGTVPAAVSGS